MQKEALRRGDRGILLANELGTSKTLVSLSVLNAVVDAYSNVSIATIVTPKSVQTIWINEERKFFTDPKLQLIDGRSSSCKIKMLEDTGTTRPVVNREFLRDMDQARADRLPALMLFIDECDMLKTSNSQQSQGAQILIDDSIFTILLSATPFSKVEEADRILKLIGDEHTAEPGLIPNQTDV
jgi:SNF2 family DNA or RNA helicase